MHQQAVRGLNVLLPALGFATIGLTVVLALLSRRSRALPFYLLAIVGFAAGGVITRFFNQPINADVMTWTAAAMPATWDQLRQEWFFWHKLRLAATAAAMILLIVAAILDNRQTD